MVYALNYEHRLQLTWKIKQKSSGGDNDNKLVIYHHCFQFTWVDTIGTYIHTEMQTEHMQSVRKWIKKMKEKIERST